ncbi:MAG: heme-copper oxidase subunit III [Pyrinomonadaceae bacterium]
MKVGTIDIAEDAENAGGTRSSRSGGGSNTPSGGGREPGDDGGGSGKGKQPKRDETPDIQEFKPGISRILTGFLLLVVLMTFGGLMAAYIVIATNNVAEWNPFDLPIQVWISTAIIIVSSLTYHLAQTAIFREDDAASRKWLVVTTVFGAAFISSQLLAWIALTSRGLYIRGNPYAGFFYILTAVHSIHVLGGITALGTILLKVWYGVRGDEAIQRSKTLAQVVGWYWHFMGALWIVLFVLLGFWK